MNTAIKILIFIVSIIFSIYAATDENRPQEAIDKVICFLCLVLLVVAGKIL